mmetsp:Transcript_30169/g.63536  ORF Transcript_30169/g.63536 Transcript_30169/m.63536 type:complete len:219 (-) Transcript_30169:456-1112(-)
MVITIGDSGKPVPPVFQTALLTFLPTEATPRYLASADVAKKAVAPNLPPMPNDKFLAWINTSYDRLVSMANTMAEETSGAKCAPLIPAKDPQKAAWPSRLSKHVEMSSVAAEEARTGEYPLWRCRNHVERVERRVIPTRVARKGNSEETPGGSWEDRGQRTRVWASRPNRWSCCCCCCWEVILVKAGVMMDGAVCWGVMAENGWNGCDLEDVASDPEK